MPVLRTTSDYLIYLVNNQYKQGLAIYEMSRAIQRIEKKATGHVDVDLVRAIAKLEAHVEVLHDTIEEQKDTGTPKWSVGSFEGLPGVSGMSADLSDEIAAVSRATEVIGSAVTLINGIQAKIDAAVAAALANGATAEELQPLSDLSVELTAQTQALADAVAANTPAG